MTPHSLRHAFGRPINSCLSTNKHRRSEGVISGLQTLLLRYDQAVTEYLAADKLWKENKLSFNELKVKRETAYALGTQLEPLLLRIMSAAGSVATRAR